MQVWINVLVAVYSIILSKFLTDLVVTYWKKYANLSVSIRKAAKFFPVLLKNVKSNYFNGHLNIT